MTNNDTTTAKITWKRTKFLAEGRYAYSDTPEQTRYTLHIDGKATDARIDRDTECRMGGSPSHSFSIFVGETMVDFTETLAWAKFNLLKRLGHDAPIPKHG